MDELDLEKVRPLVEAALGEDVGEGDITTNLTIPESTTGLGVIAAKDDGVLAGVEVARLVFESVDPTISFTPKLTDGEDLDYGTAVAEIRGKARGCLTGERVALNFLQRMSGIATLTAKFVKAVEGTRARIVDTRKTTPGLRYLEKYSVRVGGGENHRFGLYDGVLIKNNHIAAAGGVAQAVERIRAANTGKLPIEVEVRNLPTLKETLLLGVDRIMLDNMAIDKVKEAVEIARGKVELEVSGGVTLETVREIAETGVDYISIGSLTHSAPALDMSLRLRRLG